MSSKLPTIVNDSSPREPNAGAVLAQLVSGKPLDPADLERVCAQAEQVTEDIRRERGVLDDDTFQSLLDDEA
jgi:hypothetical protein